MLVQPRLNLRKREKLDLRPVPRCGIVDPLDDLFRVDPAVRMEAQRDGPLLEHRCIDGRLDVGHRGGVAFSLVMLGDPIARDQGRDLPAHPPDYERVGIVFDIVHHQTVGRQVLAEPLAPRIVQNQFGRQRRIGGRVEHEHRTVHRQEAARGRRAVENLAEEPRAD